MNISELLFFLSSNKKSLIKLGLGSSITYGAYVGAIRPSIASSIKKVDGSDIEQGKYKESSLKLR